MLTPLRANLNYRRSLRHWKSFGSCLQWFKKKFFSYHFYSNLCRLTTLKLWGFQVIENLIFFIILINQVVKTLPDEMYVSKIICAPLKKSPNWASQITKLLGLSTERPYSKAKTASSLKGELAISRRPFRQKSRLLQIRKIFFYAIAVPYFYIDVNLDWFERNLPRMQNF